MTDLGLKLEAMAEILARDGMPSTAIFVREGAAEIERLTAERDALAVEVEAAKRLTAEIRRWEPCGHFGAAADPECSTCAHFAARGRLANERDALAARVFDLETRLKESDIRSLGEIGELENILVGMGEAPALTKDRGSAWEAFIRQRLETLRRANRATPSAT